jgi:hypothetical protein
MSHQFRRQIDRNDTLKILSSGESRIDASADIGLDTNIGSERPGAINLPTIDGRIR